MTADQFKVLQSVENASGSDGGPTIHFLHGNTAFELPRVRRVARELLELGWLRQDVVGARGRRPELRLTPEGLRVLQLEQDERWGL